jgi:hypothetical protein
MGLPSPDLQRALRVIFEKNNIPNSRVAQHVFIKQLAQQWNLNRAIQQTLAAGMTQPDLQRLTEISQDAQERDVELDQVEARIRDLTPFTGLIRFLPSNKNEAYAFLMLVVATLALIVAMRPPDPVRAVTPEQVQEIIEQVIDHVDEESAPEPPPTTRATRPHAQ